MSAMHFYSWRNGLKTGQYYFRSRPARDAIKFTVNVDMLLKAADKGSSNQVLEALNSDNAGANNLQKKRKVVDKPTIEAKDVKRPVESKPADIVMKPEAEEEDSYEFDPVCHNCSG
jgi:hypothetical protein